MTGARPRIASIRGALGLWIAFVVLALEHAVAIVFTVPWPSGGLPIRALHQGFAATQTIGIGTAAALVLLVWGALRLPAWLGFVLYTGAATAAVYTGLAGDLQRQANLLLEGDLDLPIFVALVVLCGLAVPLAHDVGWWFGKSRRRGALGAAFALAAMIGNHVVTPDDYPQVHAMVAWCAATFLGGVLAWHADWIVRARRGRRVGAALVAIGGACALVVPPANQVRVELFREPTALGAWILARLAWSLPEVRGDSEARDSPWFRDRSALPPIRPTSPPVAPKPPVVVLVTIDSVRADAIANDANDRYFPTIADMKRTGAYFTRATSPGSQTAVSLTATFAGRYFSQMYWSLHGKGSTRFAYAADDETARFPALLSDAGVRTASFCSVNFLAGEFGVTRGYKEEKIIAKGRKHAHGKDMMDPLLARIRNVRAGPFFGFVHLMEPHFPYDRATKKGPEWDRYLAEIGLADAQLARIARLLAEKFPDSGYLFVAADHGEAFGEHGTKFHTKTLYEELLRVPLLAKGPGVVANRIDQPVTLVDLGPTMLDLFGVATPAEMMGQSLVPLLGGRDVGLDRPILAEGRLRRVLYRGDLKVIEDSRRKLIEVYDLARDPGERVNLWDVDPRAEPAAAALRAFFEAHSLERPGYEPPYKP